MDTHPSRLGPRPFYLEAVGARVGAADFAADPRLCALAADDIAWSLSVADWRTRCPGRWHLIRRRRWAAEGTTHVRQRDLLKRTAHEYGLRP